LRGQSDKEMPTPEEFGTGLRTHLERTRAGEPEPEPTAEEPDLEAVALAAEEEALEERRRELSERREQIAAVETTLRVREQRITEVRAKLADEERRLSAAEAELTTEDKGKEKRPADRRRLRQLLRERAEQEAERVWGAFEQGLIAAHPDGSPDVATRIAAAKALLAEAYGPPGGAADMSDESPDELAPLRKRKRGAST
jgi:hypothetical protein